MTLSKEDEDRVRKAIGCDCDGCFAFYYPRYVNLSPQSIEVKTIGPLGCTKKKSTRKARSNE